MPAATDANGLCAIGSVKTQHRPSRRRGGRRRSDQDGAGARAQAACRRGCTSKRRIPEIDFAATPFFVNAALATGRGGRAAAPRRRQLVRRRRHQRARRARGGAGSRTSRPAPRPGSCCCCRRATRNALDAPRRTSARISRGSRRRARRRRVHASGRAAARFDHRRVDRLPRSRPRRSPALTTPIRNACTTSAAREPSRASRSCSRARARSTSTWAAALRIRAAVPRRRSTPARACCSRRSASIFAQCSIRARRPRHARRADADRDHAAGAVRDRIRAGAALDVVGRQAGRDDRSQHRRIRRRVHRRHLRPLTTLSRSSRAARA